MENDWKWISKNMSSKYYDKDIESLLRKKYDPDADELLFKCSSDPDEYVSDNIVFDKKTGTTYFTDKKTYIDTRGDEYQFE